MNISLPIASTVDSVDFCFLSPAEVRSISVKRIENDSTFDNLLNPVPGGLYDPALGSWGDSPCSTCNLVQSSCPGHAGHIDLPVPVYHPIFMDQMFRLLRSQCVYCKAFRVAPRVLNQYICKLRLLRHGLVREAHVIDAIGQKMYGLGPDDIPSEGELEADETETSTVDNVARAREAFAREAIQKHLHARQDGSRAGKHEGAGDMRRQVIKDLLMELPKSRTCRSCGGVSPSYRKDRFVKVFEKALNVKEKVKMAQKKLTTTDSMVRARKKERPRSLDAIADPVDPTPPLMGEEHVEDVAAPEAGSENAPSASSDQRYLSAMEVRARLAELFEREQEILSLLYSARPLSGKSNRISADMFFITALLVPPNRYRPEARTGDAQIAEAQQNSLYKNILKHSGRIAYIHRLLTQGNSDKDIGDEPRPGTNIFQLHRAWTELQDAVNSLIDKRKNPVQGAAARRNEDGIQQKLEKKEGLFRMNMMGKRVNYAARSVISPDPNLETNEIGVPPVFAQKLTYPEPVTSHNFRDLQQAVVNGVEKWPGAAAIENENGQIVNLRGKSLDDRISLANQLLTPSNVGTLAAKNKKVYRHITNGDVVLMNRQPSLHRPSIMGHRVRVLPGEKTLRMHYANCNAYNADFDGDEMNMHFPQNEVARVEALQIADTDHQYISTTQGQPLRGLIQDHISVAVGLCCRDTLFDRSMYHQLIYNALRPENGHILGDRIALIPPAIIKPAKRWTGKQIITTLLKNLTPPNCSGLWMNAPTKISASEWGPNSEEGVVTVQDGHLVTGILDKSQIGPTSGGLVHAVHEVYGPAVAGKFLSSLGRLLTKYLNMRAFSCGMDDLKLTPSGEGVRKRLLAAVDHIGLETAANYVSLPDQERSPELVVRLEEVMRDDSKLAGLDLLMSGACNKLKNELVKELMPAALSKKFPSNRMQTMTISGAKGSIVNATLISCSLGQQVLEGRRVPLMISGKSLPCFDPFETHARAGGFVVGRFLTGIRPQEYYFHHMTGREGLIDTAVKTSRSGYLQRCVVKGMEGLTVSYDSTVRDSDGGMIQFLYGEDGLDVTKQKYLKNFGFMLRNINSEMSQLRLSPEVFAVLSERREDITRHMKSATKHARLSDINGKDPANSLVNPARYAFATSESFYESMSAYVSSNPDKLIRDKSEEVSHQLLHQPTIPKKLAEMLFSMKYVRSMVEPGEAVGIVAGQSVGEPSTQMTLNTFHLAGHSGSNVTLGIPRLREILMTARETISTPTMTLYLHKSLTPEASERFAKSISILPVGYLIDQATVRERIGRGTATSLARIYQIQLQFFPGFEYTAAYGITVSDVMFTIEHTFLKRLLALIRREISKRLSHAAPATPDIGVKVGVVEMASANSEGDRPPQDDEDGDDDDDDNDDDATNAKRRANQTEAVSYGPNDDDDDAIQQEQETQVEIEEEEPFEGEGIGEGPPPPTRHRARNESESSLKDSYRVESKGTERAERIKDMYSEVTQFSCDEQGGNWCRFTLELDVTTPKIILLNKVQDALRQSVVQQIPGVRACSYMAPKSEGGTADEALIQVDGINLRAMHVFGDLIDCDRIKTNDIAAVLETYGVEACRGAIISELVNVFRSHTITVDPRHLNLIADFMTRNGGFTPFNRTGLKGNVSPFTKMSFETTVAFLKDAVLDGDWDELATPSSRLVVGSLGKMGTGSFDVLTRVPTLRQAL